jgi:hypothetical protein
MIDYKMVHHWHASLFHSVTFDRSAQVDGHSRSLTDSLVNVGVEALLSSRPIGFQHTNHKPFFETFKFIIDIVLHVVAISHYDLAFDDFFDYHHRSELNSFTSQILFNNHKSSFSEILPFFSI